MVDEALDRLPGGGHPDPHLATGSAAAGSTSRSSRRSQYSKSSVDEFVKGVADNIDQPAQDASVEPDPNSLEPVPAKDGRRRSTTGKLAKQVVRALDRPTDRKVKAKVEKVEARRDDRPTSPPSTRPTSSSTAPTSSSRLYKNLKLDKTYTVAIGAVRASTRRPACTRSRTSRWIPSGTCPTPTGRASLAGHDIPPGPENPLKARWMGIYNGAGIHGTTDTGSLGSAASHGCVRMAIPDVIDLYDRVDVGTPIYISLAPGPRRGACSGRVPGLRGESRQA